MKTTHMAVVSVLATAAVVLGGCGGVKVTFVNRSPKPVVVTYSTIGLEGDQKPEYTVGDLDPGEKKSCRLHYDDELLQGEPQLSVTVDGGRLKSKTAVITIPRKPYTYKKLTVDITSDPDTGHVIRVTDGQGRAVPTK